MKTQKWTRLGGIAGIVYVVATLVGGFMQPSMPSMNSSVAKIVAYYTNHRHIITAGEIISVSAFVFALWWLGTVRHALDQVSTSRDPFATIALVAGGASAAAAVVGHSANALLAVLAGQPQGLANASVVRALFDLSAASPSLILFAAFIPAMGMAAVNRGMVGPWFRWFAIGDGILAAAGGCASLAVGTSTAWMLPLLVGLIGFAVIVLVLSIKMLQVQDPPVDLRVSTAAEAPVTSTPVAT